MYGLRRIVEPSVLAVSLDDLKSHLRPPDGEDDHQIYKVLAPAAIAAAERRTGRQFINSTWEFSLDRFPQNCEPIELPISPATGVVAISYTGTDGDSGAVNVESLRVDVAREPATVRPAHGESWPATRAGDSVVVQFTAGYGEAAEDVPSDIRAAILLIVERDYEPPTATASLNALNNSIDSLLEGNSVGDDYIAYAK